MRKAKSSRFKDGCDEETALRNAQRSSVTRLFLIDLFVSYQDMTTDLVAR
jgi:hypothetical protein